MIFGKGRIEIFLDKYNYLLGETISGRMVLKLKKRVHAAPPRYCCGHCITNDYWNKPKNKLICESILGYLNGD